MKIKVTRRPDLKMLSAIHTAAFHKGWSADYIAESMRVEGTLALVAEGGAGFALLRCSGQQAHILTLVVKPQARGQGAGSRLLTALLEQAKRLKAHSVSLKVNERNDAGIHLYRRRGFRAIAMHPDYYSNPDGARSNALEMLYVFEPVK